jgi:hypothetical protein
MTQSGSRADRKQGRGLIRKRDRHVGTDGEYPTVDASHQRRGSRAVDGVGGDAGGEQLATGHSPALRCGDRKDPLVARA